MDDLVEVVSRIVTIKLTVISSSSLLALNAGVSETSFIGCPCGLYLNWSVGSLCHCACGSSREGDRYLGIDFMSKDH